MIDAIYLQPFAILDRHLSQVESLVMSIDRAILLSAARDGIICLWETAGHIIIESHDTKSGCDLFYADISKNNERVLGCFIEQKQICIYDRVSSLARCGHLPFSHSKIRFSQLSNEIIGISEDHVVRKNLYSNEIDYILCPNVKIDKTRSSILSSREFACIVDVKGHVYFVSLNDNTIVSMLAQTYEDFSVDRKFEWESANSYCYHRSTIRGPFLSGDEKLLALLNLRDSKLDVWSIASILRPELVASYMLNNNIMRYCDKRMHVINERYAISHWYVGKTVLVDFATQKYYSLFIAQDINQIVKNSPCVFYDSKKAVLYFTAERDTCTDKKLGGCIFASQFIIES